MKTLGEKNKKNEDRLSHTRSMSFRASLLCTTFVMATIKRGGKEDSWKVAAAAAAETGTGSGLFSHSGCYITRRSHFSIRPHVLHHTAKHSRPRVTETPADFGLK